MEGGLTSSLQLLKASETYDPATNIWTTTSSLKNGRATFPTVMVPSGNVLAIAGEGGPLTSVESFNPATGKWSLAGNLNTGRSGHTANLLNDGRILVAGGYGQEGASFVDHGALKSAELGTAQ